MAAGETNDGHALRRCQERVEPTVTRALLVGIFGTGLAAR